MNRLLLRRIVLNLFWLLVYCVVIGYVFYANYYVDLEKKIEGKVKDFAQDWNKTTTVAATTLKSAASSAKSI